MVFVVLEGGKIIGNWKVEEMKYERVRERKFFCICCGVGLIYNVIFIWVRGVGLSYLKVVLFYCLGMYSSLVIILILEVGDRVMGVWNLVRMVDENISEFRVLLIDCFKGYGGY